MKLALLAIVLTLAATACGGSKASKAPTATPNAQAAAMFPLTIQNCGTTQTYTGPAKRIVSLDDVTTELLLAFGVQDQMVGTANQPDPILPQYAAAYAKIPVLATHYPSNEAIIAAAPDLVVGNLDAFTFDPTMGRGRDFFQSKGIHTWVLGCRNEPATFDLEFQRAAELGKMVGPGAQAQQYVDAQKASLAQAKTLSANKPPVTAFIYVFGQGTLNTPGGTGTFNLLVDAAGGVNIFRDQSTDTLLQVSPETVVSKNPDAIIVVDGLGGAAADKEKYLASLPAFSQLPAVQQHRFITISASDSNPTRVAGGVSRLAHALYP